MRPYSAVAAGGPWSRCPWGYSSLVAQTEMALYGPRMGLWSAGHRRRSNLMWSTVKETVDRALHGVRPHDAGDARPPPAAWR